MRHESAKPTDAHYSRRLLKGLDGQVSRDVKPEQYSFLTRHLRLFRVSLPSYLRRFNFGMDKSYRIETTSHWSFVKTAQKKKVHTYFESAVDLQIRGECMETWRNGDWRRNRYLSTGPYNIQLKDRAPTPHSAPSPDAPASSAGTDEI